ncbi:MAG: hypothetical protein Q4D90_03330 [bacterium]|nr:hypothetical protein [bacterium]
MASVLLFGAAELGSGKGGEAKELLRNAYGEGEERYQLLVTGEEGEPKWELALTLQEQSYTEETAKEAFQREYERLCREILGENLSLSEIRQSLHLKEHREHRGIRFSWKSEQPEVLSDEGEILLSYREKEGQAVTLSVSMKAGEFEQSFEMPLFVYPPADTLEERGKEFQLYLQEKEQQEQSEESFTLPSSYQGERLFYQRKGKRDSLLFLLLGLLAAVACYFEEPFREREEKRKREAQMLSDYAEIVSKLLVFLGAGFSIRGAWEKVVMDYERKQRQEGREERWAYERMRETYSQITSGIYEAQAYGNFGRRCGLHCYMKLGSLLEQNLRTGNRYLRDMLEKEMEMAFEEKKRSARKLGEEAGTKLVIPMVLLMAVVMVLVVVPAWMAL